MYVAVIVGKFVKQVMKEWCPSTTGPLLPTMTDSQAGFSPCQEQEGPQARGACSTFPREAGPPQGLLL